MKVEDGKLSEPNDGEAEVEIPTEFLITKSDDPIEAISKAIYGDSTTLHEKKRGQVFPRESYSLSNQ